MTVENRQLLNKDERGIYRFNCRGCRSCYIVQTGRSFKLRYGEHTLWEWCKISLLAWHLVYGVLILCLGKYFRYSWFSTLGTISVVQHPGFLSFINFISDVSPLIHTRARTHTHTHTHTFPLYVSLSCCLDQVSASCITTLPSLIPWERTSSVEVCAIRNLRISPELALWALGPSPKFIFMYVSCTPPKPNFLYSRSNEARSMYNLPWLSYP
jgi:hypothetical protein